MGLPQKRKKINAYVDGGSWIGVVTEFEPPKIVTKMEEHRGGGMHAPIDIDMGLEKMEASITMGGLAMAVFRRAGEQSVDGVRLRLVEAYEADSTGTPRTVEHYIGGRFNEIEWGTAKEGDDTEHKYAISVAYYRLVVDGRVELENDPLNGVYSVNGINRYAALMAAIS
jgi:P2 family phage contractile tail tube protein